MKYLVFSLPFLFVVGCASGDWWCIPANMPTMMF